MAGLDRDEIAKLEALYSANPEGRIFTHLAEAYRKAGDAERARELVERGLERHPEYSSAHVVLGRILVDQGDWSAAESAFDRVLKLDPENRVALRSLAEIAARAGRMADAAGYYRELLLLDPADEAAAEALREVLDAGLDAVAPVAESFSEPGEIGLEPSLEWADPMESVHLEPLDLEPSPADTLPALPIEPLDLDIISTEIEEGDASESLPGFEPLDLDDFGWDEPAPVAETESLVEVEDDPLAEFREDRLAELAVDPLVEPEGEPLAVGSDETFAELEIDPPAELAVEPLDDLADGSLAELEDDPLAEFRDDIFEELATDQIEGAPGETLAEGADEAPVELEIDSPTESMAEPVVDLPDAPLADLEDDPLAEWRFDEDLVEEATSATEEPVAELAPSVGEEEGSVSPVEAVTELEQLDVGSFGDDDFGPISLVTETMGDLYASQGLVSQAIQVYKELLVSRPGDPGLLGKIKQMERALVSGGARVAAEDAPAVPEPVETEPPAEPLPFHETTLDEPEPAEPESVASPAAAVVGRGRTIGAYLEELLSYGSEAVPATAPVEVPAAVPAVDVAAEPVVAASAEGEVVVIDHDYIGSVSESMAEPVSAVIDDEDAALPLLAETSPELDNEPILLDASMEVEEEPEPEPPVVSAEDDGILVLDESMVVEEEESGEEDAGTATPMDDDDLEVFRTWLRNLKR